MSIKFQLIELEQENGMSEEEKKNRMWIFILY